MAQGSRKSLIAVLGVLCVVAILVVAWIVSSPPAEIPAEPVDTTTTTTQ